MSKELVQLQAKFTLVPFEVFTMAEQEKVQKYNDGLVDAIATTAIITICVATLVYWLLGQ